MVQMMVQTTARGMRLLAKPVAGGAPPCQASVNSDLGMRTETVNSAMKFDFEFQRKTIKINHHSRIEHIFREDKYPKLNLMTTAKDHSKVSSHF